jgi:DNA-binding PadR family transcriptional regulator
MFDSHHHDCAARARRHHRDAGHRPPMWIREMFDPFRQARASVRRGDVRPLILAALQQQPMHGYQVIQELESQSGGRWRPSAGSVYPTLQQLEDEGLVHSEEVGGRRTYALTDEGRAAVAAAPAARAPWTESPDLREEIDVRRLAMQLVGSVMQVNKVGSPRAKGQARDILVDARRQMYRLLAEDIDEGTGGSSKPEAGPSDTEGAAPGGDTQ